MKDMRKLVEGIVRSGKMTQDSIVNFFIEKTEDGKAVTCKDLYLKAYGHTITKDLAEEWVDSMAVTDGSGEESGEKWTCEETTEVGNSPKIAIDWSKICKTEFYVAMNMMYSDFYSAAKSLNLQDDPYYYARLAKCWLMDEDVKDNKLFHYYFHVVM